MVDAYASYPKARKMCIEKRGRDVPPPFTLAHCWSHVRRKFVEAQPNYPSAATAVELIGGLYEVEREAALWPDPATRLARIAELRETKSRPLMRELRDWMMAQRVLGESGLGRAIGYANGVWAGLELYLGDPRIPICNNGAERGMRGIAVGRKNHYGSRSVRGTEVAALFYSLRWSPRRARAVGVRRGVSSTPSAAFRGPGPCAGLVVGDCSRGRLARQASL